MSLTSGARLGPYEIVAPLGAGGMGEVYRARDTRLGRDVAVKVLPQHLSANPEVRARFEREAKTVSSLSHPNICTLHDVGREGDTDYLVMELVDGETLAQRLSRGALPVAEVLRLGSQIADALDRAHRAGVVHRDLKPANVMLTKNGAKLMDFGLARATGLASPSGSGVSMAGLTQSPTMAQPLTTEGTIVGTFQYMSPEQLEGKDADTRSDIWALGCVIYEMATGRRAFDGRSQASLISSIMSSEPPAISQVAAMVPPALDDLVRTCLAKDPDERWQSAGDLRRELQRIQGGSSSGTPVPMAPRRGAPGGASLGWIAAGAIALAAVVYVIGPWSARREPTRQLVFTVGAPEKFAMSTPAEAELSPDGRSLVFTASDTTGTTYLVVRMLASLDARVIPGTQNSAQPFWSPDSRSLGYFSDGKLRRVSLDGGAPTVLCDAPDSRGGSWSKYDVIVFAPSNLGPLMRVPAKGGAPIPVTKIDASRHEKGHRYPQFLPDGKHFLFVAITGQEPVSTYAGSVGGGTAVEVCRGGSEGRFAPPGYLLFLDSGVNVAKRRLLARRFDARTLKTADDAQLILDRVDSDNFGFANVTSDATHDLVVQQWADPRLEAEWSDRSGHLLGPAVAELDGTFISLSTDGTRLAYAGNDPRDLYALELKSGVITRLTFENRLIESPIWSYDGRRIAFARINGSSGWEARVKSADGSEPDSLLFHAPGLFTFPQSWSRDGRWLVVLGSDSSGDYDLWRIPMAGQGAPELYQRTPGQEQSAAISPDGNWIAYVVNENGANSLFVQSFPTPGSKYQVTTENPVAADWSERGDELIVLDQNGVPSSISMSTTAGFHQGASHRLFVPPPGKFVRDYVPANGRFLLAHLKDRTSRSLLHVIVNWPELVEKPAH
jgi:eukaryotic-like serine/threonine-protein kinase